ncbi:uncharacterized protein LOC108603179 isoform X2 [Drosophila busckii]|uniref:uncharacterized protein LOC108603179 isoform X2 n=1 Tax=Drosophila busckii TaxID=30019 RepID=UPI00083F31F0|nr:uncharacterized protein LOC108603179 isoform X2 [Drosophila busckii]
MRLQCPRQRHCRPRRRRINYLPGLLIVLLVLLQQFELHMCRQLITSAQLQLQPQTAPADRAKRESQSAAPTLSQPEEIFAAPPNDAPHDGNYDEYPMIVPKRAALLLDRLMVALHHALENERPGPSRIRDFYADKDLLQLKHSLRQLPPAESGANLQGDSYDMYREPDEMMDYDFQNVNQINRATGETRRGGDHHASTALTAPGSATATGAVAGPGSGGGGGGRRVHHIGGSGGGNGGRMYWRCYFNAVSCF